MLVFPDSHQDSTIHCGCVTNYITSVTNYIPSVTNYITSVTNYITSVTNYITSVLTKLSVTQSVCCLVSCLVFTIISKLKFKYKQIHQLLVITQIYNNNGYQNSVTIQMSNLEFRDEMRHL